MGAAGLTPRDEVTGEVAPCPWGGITELVLALPAALWLGFAYVVLPREVAVDLLEPSLGH